MLNELSLRFLEVLKHLIKEGFVSDNKDFASRISVSTSMITEISKGRSNVGLSAIQNTVLVFPIDSDWLLTGRGSMLRTNKEQLAPTLSTSSQYPSGEASAYYQMYKEKDNENKTLIKENGKLEERIRQLENEKIDSTGLDTGKSAKPVTTNQPSSISNPSVSYAKKHLKNQ